MISRFFGYTSMSCWFWFMLAFKLYSAVSLESSYHRRSDGAMDIGFNLPN